MVTGVALLFVATTAPLFQTVGPGMASGGQTVGPGMASGGRTVGPGFTPGGVTVGPGAATGGLGFTYRTLETGQQSRVQTQRLFVLETANDYESWWNRNLGRDPQRCRSGQYNWLKDRLVAVHLGNRSTGGYNLFVTSVKRKNPTTLVVNAQEQCPPPGWMTPQMITSPWALIRIERGATNLELVVTRPNPSPRQPGYGFGGGW